MRVRLASLAFSPLGWLLCGFHFLEKRIELLETLLPELAVVFQPRAGGAEWCRFQASWTALGVAAGGDESGLFEHFEMARNGGLAHRERTGEFGNGGFSDG